jgi:hypothetical protein
MDMFMDHVVQKKALGKLSASEKKEKRRLAGQNKRYTVT